MRTLLVCSMNYGEAIAEHYVYLAGPIYDAVYDGQRPNSKPPDYRHDDSRHTATVCPRQIGMFTRH